MNKLLLSLLPLLVCSVLSAQLAPANQANVWHFGNQLAVSFVDGQPRLTPPSAMASFEGVVSLSDTLGQLLFYTNGGGRPINPSLPPELQQSTGIIWNRNHEVMYDMRGVEGGGFSARQSAIAFPDPADEPGLYYLFTMEDNEVEAGGPPEGRGLSFFLIDMALNGGLGGVRLANQQVFAPAFEALDATPTAANDGYWVVCHNSDNEDPRIMVTRVDASGVGEPQAYPVSRVGGKLEFSPNGLLLFNDGLLYAFDNETGAIASEPTPLPGVSSSATCFTPDSRFLYTIVERPIGDVIARLEVRDPSNVLLLEPLVTPGGNTVLVLATASFQIGPNGNIYFVEQDISTTNEVSYGLSEITCVSSPQPEVNRLLIELPQNGADGFLPQSLPQYVDAIFAELPLPDTIVLPPDTVVGCDAQPVTLTARAEGTAYRWSTGDTTATTAVSDAGTYCVTISTGCSPTVDCQEVVYEQTGINPTIIPGEAVTDCDGTRCVVDLDVSPAFEGVRVILYRTNPLGSPIQVSELVSPTDTVTLVKPGPGEQYEVTVTYEDCGQVLYPLQIDFPEITASAPRIELTVDGELCNGKDIELEVVNADFPAVTEVRWFDGNTDNPRRLTAEFETEFAVTAFDECGDSTQLVFDREVAEFCDCRAKLPELVSPNDDGTNDVFRLYANCPTEAFTLMIYNRWGQVVFESDTADQPWDGTKDGTPQETGMYLYRMSFRFAGGREAEVREGQFALVR